MYIHANKVTHTVYAKTYLARFAEMYSTIRVLANDPLCNKRFVYPKRSVTGWTVHKILRKNIMNRIEENEVRYSIYIV